MKKILIITCISLVLYAIGGYFIVSYYTHVSGVTVWEKRFLVGLATYALLFGVVLFGFASWLMSEKFKEFSESLNIHTKQKIKKEINDKEAEIKECEMKVVTLRATLTKPVHERDAEKSDAEINEEIGIYEKAIRICKNEIEDLTQDLGELRNQRKK